MEEQIKIKLEELAKSKEQVLAQLNAILGAEQALTELLKGGENDDTNNN